MSFHGPDPSVELSLDEAKDILAGLEEGAAVVVHGGFVLKSALSSGSISEGHEH